MLGDVTVLRKYAEKWYTDDIDALFNYIFNFVKMEQQRNQRRTTPVFR